MGDTDLTAASTEVDGINLKGPRTSVIRAICLQCLTALRCVVYVHYRSWAIDRNVPAS